MSPAESRPTNLSRSTAVMALGTLLSRVSGFGRIFALGYALNFSRFTDTYTLANNVPNIIYELVLGGVLAATLVPVFVRQFTTKDEGEAWLGVSAVLTAAAALSLVVTALVVIAAPWIIALYTIGNSGPTLDDQREVATFLLRLFAPQLALYGFISVATGLLNARRRFGPPMFAPIFNNFTIIFVLLALPHVAGDVSLAAMSEDPAAVAFLGLGTTCGVLAMALVLVPAVRSVSAGRLSFVWDLRHDAVQSIVRMSGWTIGFVIANQIALFVMLVLANRIEAGVSAFLSAYTFFILPHGIFSVSVMTALQPEMAERWSRNEIPEFRSHLVRGLRLIGVVMIPAAAGYALLVDPIVLSILHYGEFTLDSAELLSDVLFWMVLGLPGFSAFAFLTRAFQSMEDARTVFWLYGLQNALSVIASVSFFPSMDVSGLALAQTISYSAAAIVALFVLRARTNGVNGRELAGTFARIVLATTAMAGAVGVVTGLVGDDSYLKLATGILSGTLVYVVAARLLRLPDLALLISGLRRSRRPATKDSS